MSYTSVYALFKTKANCKSELRNGHGSGPAIWDYISNKLYHKKFNMFNDKDFWPCYKDSRLGSNERAVLLSTYDRSFVELERLADFAIACRVVHALIIKDTDWEWSHFKAIGDIAYELNKKHDYRCRGLAIGCTSVCDIWEQEKPENIESWGVYESMESLRDTRAGE